VKKLFFILLLVILPLQTSWAAAAAYCQHEQTSDTHFGHHTHQHEIKKELQKDASADKSTGGHSDCGYCHLYCQASFLSTSLSLHLGNQPIRLYAPPIHYSSHIPDGPKRPDWRAVA